MATAKRPRRPIMTGRVPTRYPIPLPLRYKATSVQGTVEGVGQTTVMSSQDIVFAPCYGLEPGMTAELAVDWPHLLDGRIQLQLVLRVAITGSQNGLVDAHIFGYEFRPSSPTEEEPRTEPAGAGSI